MDIDSSDESDNDNLVIATQLTQDTFAPESQELSAVESPVRLSPRGSLSPQRSLSSQEIPSPPISEESVTGSDASLSPQRALSPPGESSPPVSESSPQEILSPPISESASSLSPPGALSPPVSEWSPSRSPAQSSSSTKLSPSASESRVSLAPSVALSPPVLQSSESGSSFYFIGLTLFNFKSYVGLHRSGPFTSFNSICGSNGSGKSNLTDAIVFATMGNLKILRCKSLKSLISRGDISEADSEFPGYICYVTLVFKRNPDNVDEAFNENTTLELTTAIKNMDSNVPVYFVNRVQALQKEYRSKLESLKLFSIGNNHIVQQNKVSELLYGDTKNITKLVEKLSGSFVHKKDYDKFKGEVKTLTDKVKQFELKQKTAKTARDDAQKVLDSKKRYKLILKVKNVLESKINLANLKFTMQEIDELSRKLRELDEKEGSLSQDIADIETKIQERTREDFSAELIEAQKEAFEKKKLKENLEKEMEKLVNEIKILLSKIDEANNDFTKMEEELEGNKKKIIDLENEKLDLSIDIQRLQNQAGNQIELSPEDIEQFLEKKMEYLSSENLFPLERDEQYYQSQKYNIHIEASKIDLTFKNMEVNVLQKRIDDFTENLERNQQSLRENEPKAMENNYEETQRLKEKLKTLSKQKRDQAFEVKLNEHDAFIEKLKTICGEANIFGRVSQIFRPIRAQLSKESFYSAIHDKFWTIVVKDKETLLKISEMENISCISEQQFIVLDQLKVTQSRPRDSSIFDNVNIAKKFKNIPEIETLKLALFKHLHVTDSMEVLYEEMTNNIRGQAKWTNLVTYNGLYYRRNDLKCCFGRTLPRQENILDDENIDQQILESESIIHKFYANSTSITDWDNRLKDLKNLQTRLHSENIENTLDSFKFVLEQYNAQIENCRAQLRFYEADAVQNKPLNDQSFEDELFADILKKCGVKSLIDLEFGFHDSNQTMITLQNQLTNASMEIENLLEKNHNIEKNIENTRRMVADSKLTIDLKKEELDNKNIQYENEFDSLPELLSKIDDYKKQKDEITKLKKSLLQAKKSRSEIGHSKQQMDNILYQKKFTRHGLYMNIYAQSLENELHSDLMNIYTGPNLTMEEYFEAEDDIRPGYDEQLINIQSKNDIMRYIETVQSELDKQNEEILAQTTALDEDLLKKRVEKANIVWKKITEELTIERRNLNSLRRQFDDVKHERMTKFTIFVDRLRMKFSETYKAITNDNAQCFIDYENADEPYLDGLRLFAIPPGKTFHDLKQLSCGEKTLVTFSLIFSLFHDSFPTFFILDEFDKNSDEANIRSLVKFIRTKLQSTQFIVVSHRQKMIENADSIIGVKMQNNSSHTFSLDLRPYSRPQNVA